MSNYVDLEYRMHIAKSAAELDSLRAEAAAYLVELDVNSPLGFHYSQKWGREDSKRVVFLPTLTISTPVNTVLPSISGTGGVGIQLTASSGTWTGGSLSYGYQWKKAGVDIGGATSNTYTPVSGDFNASITVTVTATNTEGSVSATSAAKTVTYNALVNTVAPVVSYSAPTYSVTNGTWTGVPVSYDYQWKVNGSDTGTNVNSFSSDGLSHNDTVTCVVTAINPSSPSGVSANGNTLTFTIAAPNNTVAPAISSSNPDVGSVITVNTGTFTGTGITYSYQWKRNGTNIGGATANSYTLVDADNLAAITCVVTATNAAGSDSETSDTLTPEFTPVITTASAISWSGTAIVTDTAPVWKFAVGGVAYQWYKNGSPVSGQTTSTYGGTTANADTIFLRSTATNSVKTASADSNTATVVALAPANTVAPAITPTNPDTTGTTMTVSNGTWTGSPSGYTYQWKRSGTNIAAATNNTYSLAAADNATNLTCVVTATNANGSTPATSNTIAVELIPVSTRTPVIEDDGAGDSFSVVTTALFNYASGGITYQWYKNGSVVVGETGTTYFGTSEGGDLIKVRATGTNVTKTAFVDSNVVEASYEVAQPVAQTEPTIAQDYGAEGVELTGVNGTWSPPTGVSFTYQWKANDIDISGATGTTYTPVAGDYGKDIKFYVTGTNEGGSNTMWNLSDPLSVIYKIPVNTVAPSLSYVDDEYSSSSGEWDGNPDSYTYQWYKNATLVSGQTTEVYSGAITDGDELYCKVKAVNPSSPSGVAADSNEITYVTPVTKTLYWTDNSGDETGFKVEWGTNGTTFPNTVLVAANATSTTLSLPGAGTYYARVKAYNDSGDSDASNVLTFTAP